MEKLAKPPYNFYLTILHGTGGGEKLSLKSSLFKGKEAETEEMPIVYGCLSLHRVHTHLHTHMCGCRMTKEREEKRSSWD